MSDHTQCALPSHTKLVFLVGAPRSGTTWLQLLLSASPSIATAVETHLFSLYARSLFSVWRAAPGQRMVGIYNLMDEKEYFDLIRQFASKVLARILATKPSATVILEKTPDHALYWKDILAVFPDAHFIHLIRDPRAVVASLRAASASWADWESPSVAVGCNHWIRNVTSARGIRFATPNYFEVRYRDLKQDGVRTLRSVFSWCGIDISDADVERILRDNQIGRVRFSERSELAGQYASWGEDFFRKGEIESWRFELSRRQIALIERMAGELMDELGYERFVGARERLSAALGATLVPWLCNGLAWRFRDLADALNRWG